MNKRKRTAEIADSPSGKQPPPDELDVESLPLVRSLRDYVFWSKHTTSGLSEALTAYNAAVVRCGCCECKDNGRLNNPKKGGVKKTESVCSLESVVGAVVRCGCCECEYNGRLNNPKKGGVKKTESVCSLESVVGEKMVQLGLISDLWKGPGYHLTDSGLVLFGWYVKQLTASLHTTLWFGLPRVLLRILAEYSVSPDHLATFGFETDLCSKNAHLVWEVERGWGCLV
jgi:hypothetical protein